MGRAGIGAADGHAGDGGHLFGAFKISEDRGDGGGVGFKGEIEDEAVDPLAGLGEGGGLLGAERHLLLSDLGANVVRVEDRVDAGDERGGAVGGGAGEGWGAEGGTRGGERAGGVGPIGGERLLAIERGLGAIGGGDQIGGAIEEGLDDDEVGNDSDEEDHEPLDGRGGAS